MKKINGEVIIKNLEIILFFAYLLIYYMFGADPQKVIIDENLKYKLKYINKN